VGETLTNLDGVLKDVYQNVVTEQIAMFSPVAEKFEEVTEFEFDGRLAREAAIMSLNEGVGAVGEAGTLPTAGNFDPQQFTIGMKYVYGSFQMTKQMMESAQSSKGSFKNAMNYSMDSLIRNIKRERARMMWNNGSGIVALLNGSITTTTTIAVDSPGGVAGSLGGTRFIRKGMTLASINATSGTFNQALGGLVTAVSATGTSFTVTSALSATDLDNNWVVKSAIAAPTTLADTSYNKEPMGLLGLVDDGTYLWTLSGLSRTTYPQLKSRVQSSVGALSLDAIQLNFDIADQLGDAEIDTLACHHSVRRAYLALLEADRRYTAGDLKKPDGGTVAAKKRSSRSYVTFGDVNIIEDKYAPYGMLFGLDSRYFKKYVQIKGEWANESGAILRQVTGQDVWTAFYRLWENYHCSRPNTCFRMDGITSNAVYVAGY
jgi:hypothetical protein